MYGCADGLTPSKKSKKLKSKTIINMGVGTNIAKYYPNIPRKGERDYQIFLR